MQPSPAAVTAWRNTSSATSPAANTPSTLVAVEPGRRLDVTVRLQDDLPPDELGRGRVADRDEHAVDQNIVERAGEDVPDPDAGHGRGRPAAENLLDGAVPADLHVVPGGEPLAQDFFGPEGIAPVHDRHFGSDVGEIERLLDRGIAAADDHDRLAAEEKTIASRAGGDAEALELVLARQAEPLRLGAGRQDDGVGEDRAAAVAAHDERAAPEFEPDDIFVLDPRADIFRLRAHLLHEPRPLDRFGEAGIVFHVGRDHQLAAWLVAGEHERLQHGARRIDRGRIARRPGTDDDETLVRRMGRSQRQLLAQG